MPFLNVLTKDNINVNPWQLQRKVIKLMILKLSYIHKNESILLEF